MLGTFLPSNALAIVVLTLFTGATITEYYNQYLSRKLAAAAWTVFSIFWLNLIEHFAITQLSAIEGILAAVAVPACLYVAYALYTNSRSFALLTRAVTVMGLIYFPMVALPGPRQFLVETVTLHTEFVLNVLGYNPPVLQDEFGYRSTFEFTTNNHRYLTQVLLACSGLGSISIVVGLIAAVRAPPQKKLLAATIAIPVIWVLNLGRVAFITLAHGLQWLRIGVDAFHKLGITDPNAISYLLADRVIAQSMSVVALIALTLLLVRVLPELGTVLNEVLEPLLNEEYDFTELFDKS